MNAYDSWTFEHNGRAYRAELHHDSDHGAPWDESDGHGPVTDWVRRDKLPGEMVLAQDGGSRRYYDFAEASRMAKRDGWGLSPDAVAKLALALGRAPAPGDIRRAAVMADYDHLRRWCDGDWHWCGVVVVGAETGEDRSVWGIESDAGDYLKETARALAEDLASEEAASDAAFNRALLAIAETAAGIRPPA
jgi:hypothetical protein